MSWLTTLLAVLLMSGTTFTGPTIERVSPDYGGTSWWRNHDLTCIVGESTIYHTDGTIDERIWIWTACTGTVPLERLVDVPNGARVLTVSWSDTDYRILLRALPEIMTDDWYTHPYYEYLVTLSKDPSLWFGPADFDHDGDVDQSDFGLLQRQLGSPNCPMTVNEFLTHMGGAR